jgi:hypothetical protein
LATALQFVNDVTVESPEETRAAGVLARYFFACFWTIVFTGAVRKWIFPGNPVLYLLQDVPIGLSYVMALRYGFFDRGGMMMGMVILGAAITLQALAQIIFSGLSPLIAGIGLHNYLFYIPMMLVFPYCLTTKYRKEFVRWNLLLSIPMCLLAIAQANLPRAAFVNKTSEGDAFGVSGSTVARASGTFNFSSFYGIWVAIAVALCVGEWLLPVERRSIKRQWLLVVCTFTANLCHLVAASRSAIVLAGCAILGGLVGAVILRSTRAIAALSGVCILLPVVAGAVFLIAPDEYNIVMERFTGDYYVDATKTRLSESLTGFLIQPEFSLLGKGVGVGVDAAHVGSADAYQYTYSLSETDVTRNVMELGTLVGLAYVLTRLFFGVALIILAMRLVRAGSSPHVLPLSFFIMAQFYLGDLTRNAAMSSSETMLACCFVLGTLYHPDQAGSEIETGELLTRFA